MLCFFVSDLHGNLQRYLHLFRAIERERPHAVFIGGDLLPALRGNTRKESSTGLSFINDFLIGYLRDLRSLLGTGYPEIFLIPGNNDARLYESAFADCSDHGLWSYVHARLKVMGDFHVFGYAFVPPTPFRCKDWERYDVSKQVNPACIRLEDGFFTVPREADEAFNTTIENELDALTAGHDVSRTIYLFHSPPHNSALDQTLARDRSDSSTATKLHVGSIAIRNFILRREPLLALHGHIHESSSVSGKWKEQLASTWCYSAAYAGPELALIRFDPEKPSEAERELL